MIGGNKTPFRTPCAGTTSGFSFGFAALQGGGATTVDAYGNTTQMLDHCGNTIGAKPLIVQPPQDICGNIICSSDCNDCPGGFDLVSNTPRPPDLSGNTFVKSGTVNLASRQGGKWVQAAKTWHGRLGFLDTCNAVTNANTKYLTIAVESTLKLYDNGPGLEDNYTQETFNVTVTVDRDTGGITQSNCSTLNQYVDVTTTPNTITPFPGGPDLTLVNSMLGGCISPGIQEVMDAIAASDPHYASGGASVTQTSFTVDWVPSNHGDNSEFHASLTLSDPYTIDDVYAKAASMAANWLLTDNATFPFSTSSEITIAPLVTADEKQTAVSPEPSNPCMVDDFRNPIADADGNAPFSTDWLGTWAQMGWFDPDNFSWVFATGQNQSTAAATGLAGPIFTGADIGAPLPAGYGQAVGGGQYGVFNRDHANYFRRNCIFGAGWTTGAETVGAFTPSYLPGNTPQWTDDNQATTLYPCAFVQSEGNGVYLQKWCEIPVSRPSINFARPYGPDKFSLDETAVYFVSDFTSGVVTLQNSGDFSTPTSLPFTTGDIVGSARVGGFFHVTAVGTDTVTLGAKKCDLPAGWDTPSRDGAACFGKLLYPNAPGMDFTDSTAEVGGRVASTVAVNVPPTTSTITTSTTQKYLSITTPETVVLLDKDLNVLATVAATRVDDTHFTIPIDMTGSAPVVWMVPNVLNDGSTPGTKYKFADSRSKGDYVYRTWVVKIADGTVLSSTQNQACLGTSACGVNMTGFSPNGEGTLWPFPASVNVGEVWLGRIDTWMPDPFWQRPHTPVAATVDGQTFVPGTDLLTWNEDNGECNPDSVTVGGGGENIFKLFYPMKPFVESRITIPTIDGETPPTIASGVDITAGLPAPIQAEVGDAEGPLVNAIIVPQTNLSIMLTQRGCIQGGGRFAQNYLDNGTTA